MRSCCLAFDDDGAKAGICIGLSLVVTEGTKMRRRGGSEQPVKGRRANRPKARKVSTAAPSMADLQKQVGNLTRELKEAREQQSATADVLKVISRSTFDLQAVLDTLVQSAARLCEADTVTIGRAKGEAFHFEATYGFSREWAEFHVSHPAGIDSGTVSGRVLLERKIVHVLDVLADPEYTYAVPKFAETTRTQDWPTYPLRRTLLGVPLLREGSPIGVITLGRKSVRSYSEKQIELVTTFADQAVIAIENARLFEELRDRQTELARSVDELSATSNVLKIISRSSVDLETVLDTLVDTVARLCRADQASMFRRWDDVLQMVAARGLSAEAKEFILAHPPTALCNRTRLAAS